MPTLKQEFIYFNDAVGRTLPNAKMYFYEAGTTTPKNTFTSKSLANANQHPVVADAAGRFPVIWLGVGGYRVVVEDENGVTIHDRDDINVADEQLNATSSIYFNTLADLKLLIAQNGQSVNPGIGDALRTAGETTTTDDLGAEWVVVAAGTGTADDFEYVNLDNGLQAQRLFNQVYGKRSEYLQVSNNLSEIATTGAAAQEAASGNVDALYAPNNLSEIDAAGATARASARENIGIYETVSIWTGTTTSFDFDTDPPGGDPGIGTYMVNYGGGVDALTIFRPDPALGLNTSITLQAAGATQTAITAVLRANGVLTVRAANFTAGTDTDQNINQVWKIG